MFLLPCEEAVDILRAALGTVGAVTKAGIEQSLVEICEAVHDGYGDEVIAPCISDHPFRPALLVSSGRVAEAGVEVVVGPQFAEALLFDPVMAHKDLLNGACQVVVDNDGEDAAEEGEGMDVGVEERLLLLTGIGAYKRLAGEFRTHAEEVEGDPFPLYYGNCPAPVGFGLLSAVGLQDEICAGSLHPFLCFYLTHVPAHGHLASRVSFFFDETCVYPAGGVALFLRHLAVFLQPALYRAPVILENGVRLGRTSPVPGELAFQDLPDRHPGMARFLLYLPDALVVDPMCRPYVLVLIHRYHPFPPVPLVSSQTNLPEMVLGVGQFSVIICP